METLAIGERKLFTDVTLEVVPSTDWSCTGCWCFEMNLNCFKKELRDVIGHCDQYNRTDGKNVIFKAVKGKEE